MAPDLNKKLILVPLAISTIILCLAALYLFVVLKWSYSEGERIGYVQKFSKKGWICKSWEGELAMFPVVAMQAEKFLFTVRDEAVAARLNQNMGKKIALHYEEHKGVPTSCFGETPYYVVEVRVLE
jgi:lysophospholipid acyltransferase (LPLAT)-like uncharacterized protein